MRHIQLKENSKDSRTITRQSNVRIQNSVWWISADTKKPNMRFSRTDTELVRMVLKFLNNFKPAKISSKQFPFALHEHFFSLVWRMLKNLKDTFPLKKLL